MKKLKANIIRLLTSTGFKVFSSVILLSVIIGFAQKQQAERVCKNVSINITEEYNSYFIDQKDIMDLMTLNNREPLIGRSYDVLRLKQLEARVKANRLVEDAEVFRDIEGDLNVEVKQCRPIARINTQLNGSWYVSDKGRVFPTSEKFTARVPIISGDYAWRMLNVNFAEDSSHNDFFKLLSLIDKDAFLKALINEIEVDIESRTDSIADVYLYPQVGNFRIDYGDFTEPEAKLRRLKIAYSEVLTTKGWDTYKKLSIKFRNQIICE